jgi:hypothetical protein
MNDPEQQPREHQAHRDLGVDPRAAVVGAVAVDDLTRQPRQVEHPIHPDQNVIVRHQVAKRPRDEQFRLPALAFPPTS